MSNLDQIVNINISEETQAITQASFSIPAIFGPSNRFVAVTPTGTPASGSNKITGLSSIAGVSPGCSISGTDIPSGTYVTSVSGTTIYISQNATGSPGSITLTITDAIRAYTSLAGMTADGFQTTDPEYIRAQALLSQTISPPIFYVGKYSASVDQVDHLTVNTATSSHVYTGAVQGQTWSYTASGGDTTSTIATAIASAINALTNPTWNAVAVSAVVTITSTVPGLPFTDTNPGSDADYTITSVTANHTITTDIAQAQIENDTWYGLSICSNLDGDIEQVATYIESLTKIFLAVSNDTAIGTAATTDLGSILKGESLKRTGLIFSLNGILQGIECAWMGGQLPQVPGSNNWAFKSLEGISVDTLSATQQSSCIGVPEAGVAGKNVNIYQTVGGVNVTEMGTMAGGQYIDITIGVDWLKSQLQTNIFSALVNSAKIPYTDAGTAILLSAVKSAITQGVNNGLIDGSSPIVVTAPLVSTVPVNQRAQRIAPTITFTCRLAGAFNAVVVNGTVTV